MTIGQKISGARDQYLILNEVNLNNDVCALYDIRIAPYTFVQVHGSDKRYALIEAQNIPIAPEQLNFESTEDWKVITLFFEPLPLKDCTIDLIEEEKPEDTDFNFYCIKLTRITETEIIDD